MLKKIQDFYNNHIVKIIVAIGILVAFIFLCPIASASESLNLFEEELDEMKVSYMINVDTLETVVFGDDVDPAVVCQAAAAHNIFVPNVTNATTSKTHLCK